VFAKYCFAGGLCKGRVESVHGDVLHCWLPDSSLGKGSRWRVKEYAISFLPSRSYLEPANTRSHTGKAQVLGKTPERENSSCGDFKLDALARDHDSRSISRLPETPIHLQERATTSKSYHNQTLEYVLAFI